MHNTSHLQDLGNFLSQYDNSTSPVVFVNPAAWMTPRTYKWVSSHIVDEPTTFVMKGREAAAVVEDQMNLLCLSELIVIESFTLHGRGPVLQWN